MAGGEFGAQRDKEAFQTRLPAVAGFLLYALPANLSISGCARRVPPLATYFYLGSCDTVIYKKYIFVHLDDRNIFLIYN